MKITLKIPDDTIRLHMVLVRWSDSTTRDGATTIEPKDGMTYEMQPVDLEAKA